MGRRIAFVFFALAGILASIVCLASDLVTSVIFTKAITLFWIWLAIFSCIFLAHVLYE